VGVVGQSNGGKKSVASDLHAKFTSRSDEPSGRDMEVFTNFIGYLFSTV
jgi:hypothetical protein